MTKWEICGTIFFVDCYLGLEDSKWHAIVSFYRKVRFQCQISLMILDQLSLELSSMKPILLVLLPFVFVIIFFERNSVNRKHIRLLKGKKQEKKIWYNIKDINVLYRFLCYMTSFPRSFSFKRRNNPCSLFCVIFYRKICCYEDLVRDPNIIWDISKFLLQRRNLDLVKDLWWSILRKESTPFNH